MLKKIITYTICIIFIISILFYIVIIPLVNDFCAMGVERKLRTTPLPRETEIIDSVSQAGKLVGNGNGMQYFGAILLKSKLSLSDLEEYYSAYQKNEWSYIVEPQKSQNIEVEDIHSLLRFAKKIDGDGYYIVYSWGDAPEVFSELDLRGH